MKTNKYLWQNLKPALGFVMLIWLIWLVEFFTEINLAVFGVYPRRASGLLGIFTSPLIHGGIDHLISNTLPMIILPTLIFMSSPKIVFPLTVWIWICTGFWTWFFAREAYHIGASGLIYGYASFIFFAGIFQKDRSQMALSFIIIFLYSGLLFGLIPDTGHISWESHLSGAIAGTGFAYFSRKWYSPFIETLIPKEETNEENNSSQEISLEHIYYIKPGSKHSERIKLF